jgi:acyl-CoA thioester hydrolase
MSEKALEVSVEIQVRWRDLDPFGHVNNAVFMSYLETARVQYFRALYGDVVPNDFNIILARVEIDYLAPIELTDHPRCHIGVTEVGTRSFHFDYLLESAGTGRPLARARSVQVCYDYARGTTVPMDDRLRAGIVRLRAEAGLPEPIRKSTS